MGDLFQGRLPGGTWSNRVLARSDWSHAWQDSVQEAKEWGSAWWSFVTSGGQWLGVWKAFTMNGKLVAHYKCAKVNFYIFTYIDVSFFSVHYDVKLSFVYIYTYTLGVQYKVKYYNFYLYWGQFFFLYIMMLNSVLYIFIHIWITWYMNICAYQCHKDHSFLF
jgi:hypothetical protein